MTKPLEWDEPTIARYWRWQARYPEQYFTYLFGARIAHALRHHIQKGQRVLDYGCGMGFLCRHLTAFGADVWATDISAEAVSAANMRNRGVGGFHGASLLEEAIAAGQRFDRIISVEVVEHLNDEELANFFTRLLTVLAPDGLVIITTPNEEDLALSEIYCPQCDHVFHRWQHLRFFSSDSLSRKVREYGLEVVETYTTDFARGRIPNVWKSIKSSVKHLIGEKRRLPHLVCVARARHT